MSKDGEEHGAKRGRRPAGMPLRTMAINLALIATIFLTRKRWDAWVDAEELPGLAGSCIEVAADRTQAIFQLPTRMELWDLGELGRLGTYDGEAPFSECGFSPEGSTACIVSGHRGPSDSRIVDAALIVDAGDGRTLFTLSAGARLAGARLSYDKAWVVLAGEDGSARVISTGSGELLSTLEGSFGSWPRAWVSPDRRWILSDPLDGEPAILELASGRRIPVPAAPDDVSDAEFTADGEVLLVCPDANDHGKHFIVDPATGGEKSLFEGPVKALMTAPGPAWVAAVVGRPGELNTVEVRGTDGELVWSFEAARPGPDLHFDPLARLLFHGKLSEWGELWDLSSGARIVRWPCRGQMSPSGARLFLKDLDENALQVFRPSSRRFVGSIPRADSFHVIDDRTVVAGAYDEPGRIVRRIRPEEWWGVFWLWHFWVIAALAVALVVSGWRDIRKLKKLRRLR